MIKIWPASIKKFIEFSDKTLVKKIIRTCNLLCKRLRFYRRTNKANEVHRIFKFILIVSFALESFFLQSQSHNSIFIVTDANFLFPSSLAFMRDEFLHLKAHSRDFPKWSVNFTEFSEFGENNNHWSMNWVQFKDPVSHMFCAGAVVACWPLTQEVAGWQGFESFYWMTYFCHWIQRIHWKHLGKTPMAGTKFSIAIVFPVPMLLHPRFGFNI